MKLQIQETDQNNFRVTFTSALFVLSFDVRVGFSLIGMAKKAEKDKKGSAKTDKIGQNV